MARLQDTLMRQYLSEAKNTHMEHLEDLVFDNGYAGAESALDYAEQVIGMLSDGEGNVATVTTKWDGAPAIICGIDPADGRFFVGTKAALSKEPKLAKNRSSLMKYYGEKDQDLIDKLELALKVLPKLGIGGVLQGDFMFDRSTIDQIEIDGEKFISFTPQMITYAVKADSALAKRILRAKMGIVFHTAYDGVDLPSMEATFGVDVSGLNQSKEVWFDDATYKDLTGLASLTPDEHKKINNNIKAIRSTMSKIRADKFDVVIENREFAKFVKPFINQMVRDGKLVHNPIEFLKDFLDFYKGKMQIEIDDIAAKKDDPDHVTIRNRLAKIQKKEEFLEDHSNALLGVLAVYKRIVEIKHLIIGKLNQVEGLHTFIKDGDAYEVTNPEGFVAIGHHGNAVKLVDRIEFSSRNFNRVHNFGKK